jgi:hypothetical protein
MSSELEKLLQSNTFGKDCGEIYSLLDECKLGEVNLLRALFDGTHLGINLWNWSESLLSMGFDPTFEKDGASSVVCMVLLGMPEHVEYVLSSPYRDRAIECIKRFRKEETDEDVLMHMLRLHSWTKNLGVISNVVRLYRMIRGFVSIDNVDSRSRKINWYIKRYRFLELNNGSLPTVDLSLVQSHEELFEMSRFFKSPDDFHLFQECYERLGEYNWSSGGDKYHIREIICWIEHDQMPYESDSDSDCEN